MPLRPLLNDEGSEVLATGIDGIASGLNTTSLINSFMSIEGRPQAQLKTKLATVSSRDAALRSLNLSLSALTTKAGDAAKAASVLKASSSSDAATVGITSSADARPTQLTFSVGRLAAAQVSVSDAMSVWPDTPATLTVLGAGGRKVTVTAASTSLDDVAKAVNSTSTGVQASVVSLGDGTSRLQFRASATGSAAGFTVFRGDSDAVQAGTAQAVGTIVSAAADAQITLWPGSSAAQTVSSATNTFSSLAAGVEVKVTKMQSDPVTVTVARDDDSGAAAAAAMVSDIASVLATIKGRSASTTAVDSTGKQTTSAGVFAGNGLVRRVSEALRNAIGSPVDGVSPSKVGISIDKTGVVQFDKTVYLAALAADRDGTQKIFSTIANRVSAAADAASDKADGYVTATITGSQIEQRSLGDQISAWDVRLATRRSALEKQYKSLETLIGSLQTQSNYLTSQLSKLS